MIFSAILKRGQFALGACLGAVLCLLLLLFLDFFQLIPLTDSAFGGAIIGAIVAGAISIVSQLLVIISNEEHEAQKAQFLVRQEIETRRVALYRIINNAFDILDEMYDMKCHFEKVGTPENVVIEGRPPLSKPVFSSGNLEGFSVDEVVIAYSLRDHELAQYMNELTKMVQSYNRLVALYNSEFTSFMAKAERQVKFDPLSKRYSGDVEAKESELVRLYDIQENLISKVYTSLSHAAHVVEGARDRIKEHGDVLNIKWPLSIEELGLLRESLDINRAK